MRVLVIAPHNDDEVLGVGGTIAKLAKQGHEVTICEVTAGDLKNEMVQRQKREALASHKILGVSRTIFMDLPVVGLREMKTVDLNKAFLDVITELDPEIVFIPHYGDIHIDHRMVFEACMVALRPVSAKSLKAAYTYETLSETEWNAPSVGNVFIPTAYFDITDFIDIKIEAMKCHASQLCEYPHPRSIEAIKALAMHRGTTICKKYAEAFFTIRTIE